jgi:hypothetical protein
MPILIVRPDRRAETWLGALACAEGSQTWRGNRPAFTPKPNRASQKSGASSGRSRSGPSSHEPVCAASSGEKGEEASVRGVRGAEVEPAGGADGVTLAIQRDEKIGAEREELPRDEEVEAVGGHEHETEHGQHEEAPPTATGRRGERVRAIGPVGARVDGAGAADDAEQREEKCAEGVEAEVERLAADRESAAPFPRGGPGEDRDGGDERGDGAGERERQPQPRAATGENAGELAQRSAEEQRSETHGAERRARRAKWPASLMRSDAKFGPHRNRCGYKEVGRMRAQGRARPPWIRTSDRNRDTVRLRLGRRVFEEFAGAGDGFGEFAAGGFDLVFLALVGSRVIRWLGDGRESQDDPGAGE